MSPFIKMLYLCHRNSRKATDKIFLLEKQNLTEEQSIMLNQIKERLHNIETALNEYNMEIKKNEESFKSLEIKNKTGQVVEAG